MASGRVGGTRSKISGQVGNIIYQIVKNADGTYSQVEYGKPESVVQTITPKLQAQRMCTCMVEALMRDLKPVGCISMQSGANKSKSLNAFSSYNLMLVGRDCKANWNGGNQFRYPATAEAGAIDTPLGGRFMLSSGTWQMNGFDECLHRMNVLDIWPYQEFVLKRFAGFRFALADGPESVANFLKRHFLTRLDTMVFACFHSWFEFDPDPENPHEFFKHSYALLTINPQFSDDTLVTPQTISELFLADSDWPIFKRCSDNNRDFYIGFLIDNDADSAYFYTYGGFTISYLDGKKKISSSSFAVVDGDADDYFRGAAPCDVFGTWMGEPKVIPYPSPFI